MTIIRILEKIIVLIVYSDFSKRQNLVLHEIFTHITQLRNHQRCQFLKRTDKDWFSSMGLNYFYVSDLKGNFKQ